MKRKINIKTKINIKSVILGVYVLLITALCFGVQDEYTILSDIELWLMLVSIASFIMIIISWVKENNKEIRISLLSFLVITSLLAVFTAINDGFDVLLGFNFVIFELSVVIILNLLIVKRNLLVVKLGKGLIVFYSLHILVRASLAYSSIGGFIMEVLIFTNIGLVIGLPLYFLTKKRVINCNKDIKDAPLINEDIKRNKKESIINELDRIVD